MGKFRLFSRVVYFSLLTASLLLARQQAQASPLAWPSIDSFKKCSPKANNEECYQGVVDYFRSHPSEFSHMTAAPFGNWSSPEANTYVRVGAHQTDFAVVFAHGLWLNSRQFQEQFANLAFADVNFIAINLAGHGPEAGMSKGVTTESWMQDIRRATEYAHTLGKRVIVVGQSTGAALVLRNYLEDESSADAMILIEPAIRVNAKLHLGVCLASSISEQAQDWKKLISRLNTNLPDYPIELALGCLVNKIFDPLFAQEVEAQKRSANQNNPWSSEADENNGYFAQLDAIASLAHRVKIPTLMVNSSIENVVDPRFIETFSRNVDPRLIKNITHQNYHGSPNAISLIFFAKWLENVFSLNNGFANNAGTRARTLVGSPAQIWKDRWAPLIKTLKSDKKIYNGEFLFGLRNLVASFASNIELRYAEVCPLFREPDNCRESYPQMRNLISGTRSAYLDFYNRLSDDDRSKLKTFLKQPTAQILKLTVNLQDHTVADPTVGLVSYLTQVISGKTANKPIADNSAMNSSETSSTSGSALVPQAIDFFTTKSGFYSANEYLKDEARQYSRQP